MDRIKKICLLMMLVMAPAFAGGCTSSEIKAYNATATLTIKDLPDSYYDLDKKVRKKLEVDISVKDADVELKSSNDFTQTIYLEPGEYTITHHFIYPEVIAPVDYDSSKDIKFTVSRNNNTEVVVPLRNIVSYEPSEEILDVPTFSHKVQVNDKIYDMENISGAFSFNMSKPIKRTVAGKEYNSFSTNEVPGLYLLADQKDEANTPVGIWIERKNIKLWDNITVGENVMDLSKRGKGLKNHLAFCKGSPILAMSFDDTDFIYMGDEGNDKLDLLTEGNNGIVYAVSYLFK